MFGFLFILEVRIYLFYHSFGCNVRMMICIYNSIHDVEDNYQNSNYNNERKNENLLGTFYRYRANLNNY